VRSVFRTDNAQNILLNQRLFFRKVNQRILFEKRVNGNNSAIMWLGLSVFNIESIRERYLKCIRYILFIIILSQERTEDYLK